MPFRQGVFLATQVVLEKFTFFATEAARRDKVDVFLRILTCHLGTEGKGGVAEGRDSEFGTPLSNVAGIRKA